MLRCYEGLPFATSSWVLALIVVTLDVNITHVENSVDPLRDLEILDSELLLSDMELLDRFKKKKGTSPTLLKLLDRCMSGASPRLAPPHLHCST